MNDERGDFELEAERAEAERGEAAEDIVRRAERVDFALRIAHSLGATGQARPLAIAFQETVSRVVPPGDGPGA